MTMTETKIEESAITAEEILSKSGNAWIAEEQELITGAGVSCGNHKAIVRSDNQKYIGIVGKDYGVVQNVEQFSMFDIIAKKYGARFGSVRTFNGGSRIVAKLSLPVRQTDSVRNVGDVVGREILLINSFDGSTGFVGENNLKVLACLNGMTKTDKGARFMLRHTKNVKDRYAQALKIFAQSETYFDEFISRARVLAEKVMAAQDLKRYVQFIFPSGANKYSTRALNQQAVVTNLFFEGMGNLGKSAFDAYNALTEYLDHKRFDDADKASASNTFGTGRKLRDKAFAYLEQA